MLESEEYFSLMMTLKNTVCVVQNVDIFLNNYAINFLFWLTIGRSECIIIFQIKIKLEIY